MHAMRADGFKFSIAELERHAGKPFPGDKETRARLLNATFAQVKDCDDQALVIATENLMLSMRSGFLPSLKEVGDAVRHAQSSINAKTTAEIETTAERYRREAQRHDNVLTQAPPTGMIADALKAHSIFVAGGCTRREYLQLQTALHKQYPGSGFDAAQANLYERWAHKDLDGYCINAIYG